MNILCFFEEKTIAKKNYEPYTTYSAMWGRGNTGNNIFYQSIYLSLEKPYNKISFCEFDSKGLINYSVEEINEFFDAVIVCGVIINSRQGHGGIESIVKNLRGVKKPIFVFSIGVDLTSKDNFQAFCKDAKNDISEFLSVIDSSGGEIFARGYLTEDLLRNEGASSVKALGCPSMFLGGRKLRIKKEIVDKEKFKFVSNGNAYLRYNYSWLKEDQKSIFIDQDYFVELLYGDRQIKKIKNYIEFINMTRKWPQAGLKMVCEGRVECFFDVRAWYRYLIDNGFAFSLGSRIHGNIMSLVSGIPSFVVWDNTRVWELADFFCIPNTYFSNLKIKCFDDLYNLYCKLNYDAFNKCYTEAYTLYENTLKEIGLIHDNIEICIELESNNYAENRYNINNANIDLISNCRYINNKKYNLLNGIMEKMLGVIQRKRIEKHNF